MFMCNICKKEYKSQQSLCNHKKLKHNNPSNKNFVCEFCKQSFTRKNNMNYHKNNICKEKNIVVKNTELENKINILTSEVNKLKSKNKPSKNINNGIIINGNVTINQIGNEDLGKLDKNEIMAIFNKELESIVVYVELMNFNDKRPENHSFCTTSIEGQYLSAYNAETKKIELERKKYFFDKLLTTSIDKMEILYCRNKYMFTKNRQHQIEDTITNLKSLKEKKYNDVVVREIVKKFNLISYNNREIVKNTWETTPNKKERTFSEDLEASTSEDEPSEKLHFSDATLSKKIGDFLENESTTTQCDYSHLFIKAEENVSTSDKPKLIIKKKLKIGLSTK